MYAQTDTIRYVSTSGSYNNDGLSWDHPKNRLQDAINDLRDYLLIHGLSSGSVYVAAGTYVPTESTESDGGSMLNTSFKIYSGIHVYGGFNPTTPEARPGLRKMVNGKNCEDNWSDPLGVGTTSGDEIASQWDLQYKTILSGNHSTSDVMFVYDSIRGRYNTAYPASSYHVVWFATNGKYETGDETTAGHFRPLEHPASVDGCVLTSGNASTRATNGHEHTAYGGGAYLVGNATLKNCIVERCNATLRGGGVYLDGGGIVEFCKIMRCQAVGVGVVQGYGGGACIDYDGQVGHSHIMSNAARCGGGLAICHITGEYPLTSTSNYSPFSSACVINNNTASAEGGGIYLAEGGTINHATVTANECVGPDVTYYGRRHGRSGGIYIRDCGLIFNSVFWGNRCATNNDIQFASVRQVIDPSYETFVYHTAFMNHDITDWTNVRKDYVFSLDKHNMPVAGSESNFPCFFAPTVDPLDWTHVVPGEGLYGPGVFKHLGSEDFPGPRVWHLTSYSAIDQKGVQVNDAIQDASPWLRHAHTDYGVVSNPYEPVSTLGALVRRPDPLTYALVVPQGLEGRQSSTPIPTLFIDPKRKGSFDGEGHFVPNETEGGSWDTPIRDIGEAVKFFRQYLVDDEGGNHHYMIPALEGGKPTGDLVRHEYVQILMKEGTITTVGPDNYLDRNIRTASVRIESHMRMYGGYPSSLTGTNTAGRNPRTYKSTITANLTGKSGTTAYTNNAAHVIVMANVEHAVVDGFTLSDANTHNVYFSQSAHAGAGVLVNNVNTPQARRIDMVGNQLRNCVINNCTAPKGAAIYVNGEYPKADGEICYAELMLMNCVIRNNKADYAAAGDLVTESHGIITANGRAYLHLEHCDIVNNVGYPFKADSKNTDTDEPIYCAHDEHGHQAIYKGYIRVDNSLVFCNSDRVVDDRGLLGTVANVLSVNADGQDHVFGKWNMFDADLVLHLANPSQPLGFFADGFAVPITDHFLPDGVTSHYTDDIAGIPADAASRGNQCIFTRDDSSQPTYPMFLNPARNVGNAPDGDKPLYGGIVSYTPMNTNPCVNAAHPDDYTAADNFDRSDVIARSHGGAPDIGAIENTDLPMSGEVIYVTPDGAGKRDGSSWDNAIAGNTVYRLYNAPAATGDSVDVASGARLINRSTGDPVSTDDDRYCGGYATKYVYPIFYDYGKAYTRNLEINVYEGGTNAGRMDTLHNDTTATSSIPGVRYNNKPIPADIVSTKAVNADYPYGEMSGVSRYIYRAAGNYSPLTEDGSSVMFAGISVPSSADEVVASGRLVLTNERRENYVSGLQYAVEIASQTNKLHHKDSVQVWVSAGKYTDYKGFIMRDSVSVYGGFPAGKYAAPGMTERRALMSNVVAIPKSKENEELDAEDYETILQISDVNPQSGTGTTAKINTAAIKFYDNGQSVKLYINNNISRFTDNNTIHYYRWNEGTAEYELDRTDNIVTNSSSVKTTWSDELYGSKSRNYLRKRVLQMPDVTNPVYCHGLGDPGVNNRGKYGDALSHYERVIKDGRLSNVKEGGGTVNGRHQDPNYKEYNNVYWDGFTIRHGFLTNMHHAHAGGAGVSMFEGARLVNCIVTDNFTGCRGTKGGGVFCDGSTSTIENCFILNNTLTKGQYNDVSQSQGAGLFLYEGTCFNSLMANNWAIGPGGGVALCVGKFYNNTLAYNTGNNDVGGLRICTGSEPALFMANTVIFGNNGLAIDITDGTAAVAPFINCYIQSATTITKANFLNAINDHVSGVTDGYFGRKNTFLNNTAPSATNTPFAADVVDGVYDPANPGAKLNNDFALRQVSGIRCINSGEEDFEGAMYEAVRAYLQRKNASLDPSDAAIRNEMFFKNVVGVQLPQNDVVYAKRIQDCQVDIGAYEFNAAFAIRPDTISHPGKAIFYVAFESPGGDASASSPESAACRQKIQQVIDAAGRYKYALMTAGVYDRGYTTVADKLVPSDFIAGMPNKCWSVEVWLTGDDTNSTTTDAYTSCYVPVRSTLHGKTNYIDNTLDYSLIIPHGVQIKGGFADGYFHYEKDGVEVAKGTPGATVVDDRDPLTYRTVLSGRVVSNTGAEGQCFHVVTFTNNLFDIYEETVIDEGGQLAAFDLLPDAEMHRAVLDGLFIEDGFANSPDEEDRRGAAAVVTGYAHVRNCVIQNNEALSYGGGLYLQPHALVSGSIIKNNSANIGGGIYIEAPEIYDPDTLARVYSTTICQNRASATAGGMWFDNTYARVNSTVIWQNTANDFANVSGSFTRTSSDTDYPFNYCAVESRRLEGQCNIELSPRMTEGVRWDESDPFNTILYYPIEMSSTLSRAGMTYNEWRNLYDHYPTLDSIDMAGVCRIGWLSDGSERGYAWGSDTLVTKNNDFIEIGARALNKDFSINVDPRYVMRRLFVMHTEMLNTDAARALQENTNTDDISNMYRQMGSCMLNPFHRLGDAFDYIIAARMADPAQFRNARFEVYVEQGTYYPYHNAYGEQGQVRNNTFLIPEATTIIGGVNSQTEGHNYCQAGYVDRYTHTKVGDGSDVVVPGTGITLDFALADSIRLRDARHRPMRDLNLNTVIEPWELERQSILSGNAVSGEDFTHVYHVVTIHADSTKIGPQPFKYRTENDNADWENGEAILTNPISQTDEANFISECERSLTARAIILDGISVVGGYANHLSPTDTVAHAYQKKTYFRGGGIFVDGNWTRSFDIDDGEVPQVTLPATYNIPLVIRNCQFSDNMAANGGAIFSNGDLHIYASHFTQNYSQGPMTKLDQRFIPWSSGGCIAANSYCGIVNTLLDNNEARRGLYPITIESGTESIPDADARQGFGGGLSISPHALLRAENCHFMRNKAVAYSAIYNVLANNHYTNRDSIQTAFNTMFWGNEVFDIDNIGELQYEEAPSQASIDAFNEKYKSSRAGVFHYDGAEWNKYERLFHEYDSTYHYWVMRNDTFNTAVTSKLAELREQGNKVEGMFYCSYRQTYGPSGMRSNNEGYLLTEDEYRNFIDARALSAPVKEDPTTHEIVGNYTNGFTSLRGNNNVLINRVNTAPDGPNFRQPSMVAGIDGYMQNADWLPTKKTITADQGWGHLKQRVERDISHYITDYTGDTHFDSPEEALAAAKAVNPSATMSANVKTIYGLPVASFDVPQAPLPGPLYNYLAWRASRLHSDFSTPPLPCGDEVYMTHNAIDDDGTSYNMEMLRISKNPRVNVEDVYIDMGIYEYQYIQLDLKGNEIDTVWVAPVGKDVRQTGLTWDSPTTDLQYAIDLVLSSHNNHDKYVCLLGSEDGSIIPTTVLDNRRTFTITSGSLEPLLPDSALADEDYSVRSLTFLGGYNPDVRGVGRDPQTTPSIIEMPNIGNHNQLNQLFIIEDMSREQIQANWQGELRTRENTVIPITFDGITFVNPYSTKDPSNDGLANSGGLMSHKGGAAIYYRWQRQYVENDAVFTPDFNYALYPDSVVVDKRKVALPKLTLSNCIFMDNGDRSVPQEERSPAVRIDHGGGKTLVVNSLFHSNAGAPIYARTHDIVVGTNNLAEVPNDVIIVNSTFALNDGHLTLDAPNSELHNSIIWLDDLANDTTVQFQINGFQWDRTTNKNRIGVVDRVTNNAVWGCFQNGDDTYNNENLITDNYNIFHGPYFIAPNVSASTAGQRRQRNFRLSPGVKTMNTADTTLYRNRVFFRQYPDNTFEVDDKWWSRPVGFREADIHSVAEDRDLSAMPRLNGMGMERGAYECQAAVQRVVYVRPNLAASLAGDGSTWEHAFGQGQLQSAIDVASVYNYFNRDRIDADDRKAYVFVKGSNNSTERVDLIARDGVFVFGSIPGSFNDTAWLDDNEYMNRECERYINYVRATAPGLAAPGTAASRSRITSVHAETDEFNTGFLLDGFVISNPDTVLENSPIVLNSHIALRNCIFTDNHMDGAPLVDLQRGLVYNSLFYGNEADTTVKVGANGLVLNNTIIASRENDLPIEASNGVPANIINNITHNEFTGPAACFATYMTDRNPYTLPAYLSQYPELAYQLHEHSRAINTGTEFANLPTSYDQYKSDRMVRFDVDRDLLGNPRRIGGNVDLGAFETWEVAPKQVVEITAKTNIVMTEAERNSAGNSMVNAFTDNYGGNKYPHPGSVVYLMDSSAITMAYEDNEFEGVMFRPGFMLMKQGASFYGNGNNVQMNYVAVEKRLNNQQFAMNAFPFDWYANNITTSSYNNVTDAITSQLSGISFKTYQYNGIARSAKDYSFQPANSTLWMPVDTAHRVATEGYLVDYNTRQDTLLRFNAFASVAGSYIYTEDADDKVIALKQHDNHVAGSGSGLNFTRQEDMGWNMKGLPWLVSGYRTDTILEEGNYQRQMFIPHVFYYMNADGDYLHMTDPDRIYAARSWDSGSKLTMGDAFLTQTATMQDHEDVLFRHPYFGMDDRVARPVIRVSRRRSNQTDYITVIPDSAADKRIEYRYGRDGVKWSGDNKLTSAYILDNSRSSQVSLLGAAPIDTDIPLGVYVPEISESTRQNISAAQTEASDATTFSLPEKEAFAGYKYVYLIDYERHTYTNLQDEDYTVNLAPGRYDKRFALRIGGYSIQDELGKRTYTIFVLNGTLHVHGLLKGDYITVFAPSGQLITQAYSSGASFTTPLPIVSGYVVKVNDHTQKVIR